MKRNHGTSVSATADTMRHQHDAKHHVSDMSDASDMLMFGSPNMVEKRKKCCVPS